MEGIGSYISVIGLSALFSGDWVIIAMAVILDIAKITSVSFLYRYWSDIRRAMRYYMTAAVLVLMFITSAGAFGYLSAAFQKAVQPNLEVALKVEALTRQQESLEVEKKELTALKLSINKQIADIPTENERSRRQLIASMRPELERTNKRLETVNLQLDDIRAKALAAKGENVEKDVHAGPIMYVSKAFGISLEDASKYIILVIVLVFDPLAIMLVLAANFLIKRKIDEPEPTPPTEPKPVVESDPVEAAIPPEVKLEPVVTETKTFTAEDLIEHISPEPAPTPKPVPEPASESTPKVEEPPVVDVATETNYSGSPQTEHIDPLPVRLEKQGMVLK